jgi:hypothetical protein
MFFEQRTLNLMLLACLFFFMRAAVALSVEFLNHHVTIIIIHSVHVPVACMPRFPMDSCIQFPPSYCNHTTSRNPGKNVHLASLRLQISMNCLMSETSEGILTVMSLTSRWNFGIVKFEFGEAAQNHQIVVEWKPRYARVAMGLCKRCHFGHGSVTRRCGAENVMKCAWVLCCL